MAKLTEQAEKALNSGVTFAADILNGSKEQGYAEAICYELAALRETIEKLIPPKPTPFENAVRKI